MGLQKRNCSIKSSFVISISHRLKKLDPETIHKPKSRLPINHEIPLLILDNKEDVISLLCRYTDFGEFNNWDYFQSKQDLKDMTSFICEITNLDLFKKEILWKPIYSCSNYFFEIYDEHCIDVTRLPIGIVKRHHNEDLF